MGNSGIARAQKYGTNYLAPNIFGDLNQDGNLDILDILIMVQFITDNVNNNTNADLNQDNLVNIFDILILVNLIILQG